MNKFYNKLKQWALKGFKYGKVLGIIWIAGFFIMLPILFIMGGYPLVVAYIICKFTGMCPL